MRLITACLALALALASCAASTPAARYTAREHAREQRLHAREQRLHPGYVAPAPTPAPETEWRSMQIDTEPEGAAITLNGENVGYSPVTVNVQTEKATGKMAGMFMVQAIPTGPGQYTQYASNFINLMLGGKDAQTPQGIILYMYRPTQAR